MNFMLLNNFNPRWVNNRVSEHLLGSFHRVLFKDLLKFIDKRMIILIYGLRRVGKTTLLYQLIQHLLNKKVKPINILYFSFDERRAPMEEIIKVYEHSVLKKSISSMEKVYVFFDEIQKLDNWQDKIKIFYDLNPQVKIFLSGSASVSLQKKSKETLAGRIFDFYLKVLSFNEFLEWKGVDINHRKIELYENTLTPLLNDGIVKN